MINIKIPGAIRVLVGDLHPMRMTNLLCLKGGIQVFDGNHSFRAFGLLNHKCVRVGFRKRVTGGATENPVYEQ